ncbi:TonB-dependent receptor [Steroidobacter agaridevorans]|uniref:TonB-dependent receptor n=1 Tax=Steroidobacter agaridevorans TaxID=2695856 RepID=UPI001328A2CC|nr:TonB-dependent receptor [Steroidobacter agaridevorans]GFE87753.1 TonB-dependent receptor [Steroidobacter agaridevorans]
MSSFAKRLTVCSLLIGTSAYSQFGSAQSEPNQPGALEEIVVTGYRSSLNASLDLKRDSIIMGDSIVAEDIGDFPDTNLAEAMARIPGVTTTRADGRGKNLTVRGLNSTFTRTTLNGMEVQAVDFNTRDRSFDFNVFASELFTRIDVAKSTEARMEEGSLGATIDLHTARPLEMDRNTFVTSAELGQNENANKLDPRFAALLSMKNDAGTFGGALSVAYSDTHTANESHNSGRWEANSGAGANRWRNSASLPAEINNAYHPRFPRYFNGTKNFESLGATGALQWAPTDSTLLTFDALHSSFDWTSSDPALTPISLSRTTNTGRLETTLNAYEYDASKNALLYADMSGIDIRSEGVERDNESTMNTFSLTLEQGLGENVNLRILAGTSKAKSEAVETLAILEAFNQNFTYDYRNGQSNPTFTYGFDLANPANWLISESRYLEYFNENTYDTLKADLSWEINDTFKLSGGASQKEYEFDLLASNRNLSLHGSPQGVVAPPAGCNITQQQLAVGSNLGRVYTDWRGQSYFLADWDAFAAQLNFPGAGSLANDPCFGISPGSAGRRNVQETDSGAYAQLDFKTEIASRRFFGNVGVRYVETEVDSTGDIATAPVTVTREYSDTLPSVNLGLWATDGVVVRASWAKVMARPDLADLTPGGTVDGFNRRYTAGNPGLEPFRAEAIDLAVEWYFAEEALVSLAYFGKDIESFPASVTRRVTWQSLGLPDSLLANTPATPQDLFDYIAVQNGPGGTLEGYELQFQTPFNFGPNWIRSFGVKLNYTDISSEVRYGDTKGRLLNQSDTAYNATLWYEKAGFSGRVSYTHTGDAATRVPSLFNVPGAPDAGEDITDDINLLDAKVSYRFNDALSVSLDMLNLTDEVTHTLMGTNGLLLEDLSNGSGRQYFFGVQYAIR